MDDLHRAVYVRIGIFMRVLFIRHGKTLGNMEKRYIGRSDEALADVTKDLIQNMDLELKQIIASSEWFYYSSPMRRCVETLELLTQKAWNALPLVLVDDLRECDFGCFEGKNYLELQNDKRYQRWIDSNGEMDFPEGEKIQAFKERCQKAFYQCMCQCDDARDEIEVDEVGKLRDFAGLQTKKSVCFVVHGGTIMSICEKYALPKKGYYDYQIGNLDYLEFQWDGENLR